MKTTPCLQSYCDRVTAVMVEYDAAYADGVDAAAIDIWASVQFRGRPDGDGFTARVQMRAMELTGESQAGEEIWRSIKNYGGIPIVKRYTRSQQRFDLLSRSV